MHQVPFAAVDAARLTAVCLQLSGAELSAPAPNHLRAEPTPGTQTLKRKRQRGCRAPPKGLREDQRLYPWGYQWYDARLPLPDLLFTWSESSRSVAAPPNTNRLDTCWESSASERLDWSDFPRNFQSENGRQGAQLFRPREADASDASRPLQTPRKDQLKV